MTRGPCAKRRVTCAIVIHGSTIVFHGENDCANPQPTCPRAPGEGYEKCKTICQQAGHAETEALKAARLAGANVTKAVAYIGGHYWMCADCGAALRDAGVASVVMELAK